VLADYGADVIKVERPGAGDLSRGSIADDPDGQNNPVFRSLNRNKRSIALDMRKDDAKAVIYELVKTADVVINNFRAGVMERMGFGHDKLSEINPRIISAFGSGFGAKGPLSHKGGQDILAQALSGVMLRKADASLPTRSIRPRSATTRPACIWCRRSCWRSCSAKRPAAASPSRSRCSNRCSPCRSRKRRCGCSARRI
jgi:crotonobetainyl-CoA:carnitine CoA-transferase CaiB-like acyl-CoA transferase